MELPPEVARTSEIALKGTRRIHFGATSSAEAMLEAMLYERDRLDIGMIVAGPAIVEQSDATTVIPAGWSSRVDGYRNLILERKS